MHVIHPVINTSVAIISKGFLFRGTSEAGVAKKSRLIKQKLKAADRPVKAVMKC